MVERTISNAGMRGVGCPAGAEAACKTIASDLDIGLRMEPDFDSRVKLMRMLAVAKCRLMAILRSEF